MGGRAKTNIVLVDQAVVSGTNFLTGLLLARFLGLEGYGLFVLAYGVIQFISGIQVAIVISPMMVNTPRLEYSEKPIYLSAVSAQQVLFSIVVLLLAGPVIGLLGTVMGIPKLGTLAAPLAFTAALFITQDYLRRMLIVTDHSKQALINDIISYGLQLAALIYYFSLGNPHTRGTFWIIAFTSGIAVLHGIFVSRQANLLAGVPAAYRAFAMECAKVGRQHWDFGKWLLARNIAYWGSSQFLIYLAGAMLSASAVGALTATRNIVGLANILFLALENIVPSRAAIRYKQQGASGLRYYLLRVSVLGGGLTGLIVVITAVSPEFWLHLAYGNDYAGYGWLVIGWGIYYIVGFFHRPLSAGLRAIDRTRDIFLATVTGTISTLLIGYPLIRLFSLEGVLFSLIFIQTVMLIVLIQRLYQRLRHA
ncbi:MAG TPA: hypothetical protein ENJ79_06820 [Gammaproteobacteria bacterium]|nr:hypothetical protein [Gammaproteobacteria bacterium]